MKNRYITFLFFFSLLAIALLSCHKDKPVANIENTSSVVCFASDVRPIFKTYCASAFCHSSAAQAGGYILDSFQNIISHGIVPGDTAHSLIYQVLVRNDNTKMPKPPYATPITDSQRILIARWIMQGAKNNSSCQTCDTSGYHYHTDIQPLIQLRCGGCHGGATPSGGLILGGYYNDSLAINGIGPAEILNDIKYMPNAVPMPPAADLGKMSDCDIYRIQRWIEAGLPND